MTPPSLPREEHAAWASAAERGSPLALRFALWFFRRFGAPFTRLLLPAIVAYYCVFARQARRASRAYLERVRRVRGEDGPPPRLRDTYRHLYAFAESILDKFSFWAGASDDFDVVIHGGENMEKYFGSGGGAFLVGAHFGNFDVLRVIARNAGVRVNVLLFAANARRLNAAAAVARNSIARVVNLSSFGAHIPTAAGPVEGLHDNEERLDEFEENIVHLRPGFFMENYLAQLDSIRTGRVRFPLVDGSVSVPMVATRDIAHAAAQLLLHPEWSGHHILGLHGPRDLTFGEAAEILGVVHETAPVEEARERLLAQGASEDGARLVLNFFAALADGALASGEERTERTTTATSFEQFAEETLRPRLDS